MLDKNDYLTHALYWHSFGLKVIPVIPNSKQTAVKWTEWLNNLSPDSIIRFWTAHPNYELGFILDENILVLDADTPEAVETLHFLEGEYGVKPTLTVRTKKGWHHYYRRNQDTYAHADSHSSNKHPERLDVKTGRGNGFGRSMVILPPSTGKTVGIDIAKSTNDLPIVDQDFIDAVFTRNGRDKPRLNREPKSLALKSTTQNSHFAKNNHSDKTIDLDPDTSAQLNRLLTFIPSDSGRNDWFKALAAIHHTCNGSDYGFSVADEWSRTASNYCGTVQLRQIWNSLFDYQGKPATIGTLCKMAKDNGATDNDITKEHFEIMKP